MKAIDGTKFKTEEEVIAYEKEMLNKPFINVEINLKGEDTDIKVRVTQVLGYLWVRRFVDCPQVLNETAVPRDAYTNSTSMYSDYEVLRVDGPNYILGRYQNNLLAERLTKAKIDEFCKRHNLKRI